MRRGCSSDFASRCCARAPRRTRDDLRGLGLRARRDPLGRLSDHASAPGARPAGASPAGLGMRDHFQEFDISPEIVNEMIEAGEELVLVDVREDWEWEKSHIEGAIHIPLGELPRRIDELDPESWTIVYCHTGEQSVDACLVLWDAGFRKVRNLSGGIDLWSEVIDPDRKSVV